MPKTLKQYVVDAFTNEVFKGNPAAVCVLEQSLPDELMQKIAIENNLSETAFAVKKAPGLYGLRWFTPGGEVDLCGHATLGTSFVILSYYEPQLQEVQFETQSGVLTVVKRGDLFEMQFPAYDMKPVEVSDAMQEAIGSRPLEAWLARDLVCVLENEDDVIHANVDLNKIKALDGLLVHITAKGSQYDCVSRSYAPKLSVPEDPVCGSGHCHIIPVWQKKTGKTQFVALQASKRSGVLYCRLENDKVYMAGQVVPFSEATIQLGR